MTSVLTQQAPVQVPGNNFYGYENEDSTVLTFLPSIKAETDPFYTLLNKLHTAIDTKHDQEDTVRGSSRLLTDFLYREYLKNNIMRNSFYDTTNYRTDYRTTNGDFDLLTDSVHKLYKSLLRNNNDQQFDIDGNVITLPKYVVVSSETIKQNKIPTPVENCQFEISDYSNETNIASFVQDTGSNNSTYRFVNDCGSSDLYEKFLMPDPTNTIKKQTSVFSGIMDSSSSNESETEILPHYQVFIPFMPHPMNPSLTVWMYCVPIQDDEYRIKAYFTKPIPKDVAIRIYRAIEKGSIANNQSYFETYYRGLSLDSRGLSLPIANGDIPTLPDISIYIASEGYNGSKKCIDFFIKTNAQNVIQKCKPFLDIAKNIFDIPQGAVIDGDNQRCVDCFFMQIKHYGDRFRAIDAKVLRNAITGTCDSFLKNLIVLALMNGVYANKGHNLVVSNIRQPPSPEELQEQQRKEREYIESEFTAMRTYLLNSQSFNNGKVSDFMQNCIYILTSFFNTVDLHLPRGNFVRRITSIIVPKKFKGSVNVSGIDFDSLIFDETEIQEIWKLYNVFVYFSKRIKPTGTRLATLDSNLKELDYTFESLKSYRQLFQFFFDLDKLEAKNKNVSKQELWIKNTSSYLRIAKDIQKNIGEHETDDVKMIPSWTLPLRVQGGNPFSGIPFSGNLFSGIPFSGNPFSVNPFVLRYNRLDFDFFIKILMENLISTTITIYFVDEVIRIHYIEPTTGGSVFLYELDVNALLENEIKNLFRGSRPSIPSFEEFKIFMFEYTIEEGKVISLSILFYLHYMKELLESNQNKIITDVRSIHKINKKNFTNEYYTNSMNQIQENTQQKSLCLIQLYDSMEKEEESSQIYEMILRKEEDEVAQEELNDYEEEAAAEAAEAEKRMERKRERESVHISNSKQQKVGDTLPIQQLLTATAGGFKKTLRRRKNKTLRRRKNKTLRRRKNKTLQRRKNKTLQRRKNKIKNVTKKVQ